MLVSCSGAIEAVLGTPRSSDCPTISRDESLITTAVLVADPRSADGFPQVGSGDGQLRHVIDDVATMGYHLGDDLHQLLTQGAQ